MIKNIIISILIFSFMYVSCKLIKMRYDEISAKQNEETSLQIDLVICNSANASDVKACVILTNKEFDIDELNRINKTLIDNHGLRLYKTKK